eukprot:2125884-Pyramimonas_sp.AAC.1
MQNGPGPPRARRTGPALSSKVDLRLNFCARCDHVHLNIRWNSSSIGWTDIASTALLARWQNSICNRGGIL